jgi:hypothetical protein
MMKKEDLEFFENLIGKDNIDGGFGRQYNLFVMEQGILIAESLQTKEAIIEFKDKDWNEQKILVPGLDDGHSGNTFNMALRFAIAYLPQLLVNRRDERIDNIISHY